MDGGPRPLCLVMLRRSLFNIVIAGMGAENSSIPIDKTTKKSGFQARTPSE